MNRFYVKPATAGAVVRDPDRDGRPLPPEGAFVPRNTWWLRRLRHGDVTEAHPPKAEKGVIPPKAEKPARPAAAKKED